MYSDVTRKNEPTLNTESKHQPTSSWFPCKSDRAPFLSHLRGGRCLDLPGGPVVKNPPCNAGNSGLIPSQGTKIPQAHEPHDMPT